MSTFIGDFVCKADAKGRIVMPSVFKNMLESEGESRIVVKKDIFEQCLVLYPYSEWDRLMNDLRQKINPYDREHTRFFREFQRNTAEMQLDANGRFLAPRRLMTSVLVEKDVILLGVDKHIELWSTNLYDSQALPQEELGRLAENILGQSQNR